MADEGDDNFEVIAGLTLAVLAAALAITDLGAGKYGDDEIIGTNEKSSAYSWYQSKSVKQSIVEQEDQLLRTLIETGSIVPERVPAIEKHGQELREEIQRYKAEKKEILEGSAAVGPEGQVLEKDGQKGQIVGANEHEARLEVLGAAGDTFDLATLFLQMSLVFGAISIVLKRPSLRWGFYWTMVGSGGLGAVISAWAYSIAMS